MELLMGERLYRNPVLALRELLQNSMDAIKVREKILTPVVGLVTDPQAGGKPQSRMVRIVR
jgi:HSP90 family molecular chaperone